jgi:hypothetical protein
MSLIQTAHDWCFPSEVRGENEYRRNFRSDKVVSASVLSLATKVAVQAGKPIWVETRLSCTDFDSSSKSHHVSSSATSIRLRIDLTSGHDLLRLFVEGTLRQLGRHFSLRFSRASASHSQFASGIGHFLCAAIGERDD